MQKIKKNKFLLLALVLIVATLIPLLMSKKEAIKIGDKVPSFTLKDQNGLDFSSQEFAGKTAMVIYFYPKDDTPGCTKEACSFRDTYDDFRDLNAKVIGISADNVSSHKKFAEKYNLPFNLLADTKNQVRKLFGVPNSMLGFVPGRVTYIVNEQGFVTGIYDNMFNSERHIKESLKALKK